MKGVWLAAGTVALSIVLAGCAGGASMSVAASGQVGNSSMESPSMLAQKVAPPTGGLQLYLDRSDPEELSASQVEDAERAIRAYAPVQQESLLRNDAREFFYYERLTGDARVMYEGIMGLAEDPTAPECAYSVKLSSAADLDQVKAAYALARLAVQYDHPELFWLYNGLETDVEAGMSNDGEKLYLRLAKPYKNYAAEMKAFNEAVDDFLADIDRGAPDDEISLAIHDKLIGLVSYDFNARADAGDLAHTAYGALVEDSAGMAHAAVCDGYAQAYVYLLQQCGISAAVVLGDAGPNADDADGHAWVIVKLDDDWYEVDVTWDDPGETIGALADAAKDGADGSYASFAGEAIADDAYWREASHYLYNLTTKAMAAFPGMDGYWFEGVDGEDVPLAGACVHIRASELPDEYGVYAALVALVPEAKGTKYAYAA